MIANHPIKEHNYSHHIRGDRSPLTSPVGSLDFQTRSGMNRVSVEDLVHRSSLQTFTSDRLDLT